MKKDDIRSILPVVSDEVADFTVGFATLSTSGGRQDADPAGSGALVTVRSVRGILTAAHVLKRLPNQGEVGLVRFPRVQSVTQRLTIDMGHAEKLTLAADVNGPEGPDIGFLRLSPVDAETINARNVFFNLGKRQASVLADHQPDLSYANGPAHTST